MLEITFPSGQSTAEEHTSGNVDTALLDDARGGSGLDSVEVLADTGVVGGSTLGVGRDGRVEAGQSAAGDISAGLGLGQSGESNSENGGGLHFDDWIWIPGELIKG